MYPWLWLWAPRIQLPWSGNVAQDIDPTISSFFGSIKAEAGNARIEERAFAVASYGKQLGLIAEVLIGLAEREPDLGPKVANSLKELKQIQGEIELIKDSEYKRELQDIEARLTAIHRRVPAEAQALLERLRVALSPGDA